jgi:hypothetical protein
MSDIKVHSFNSSESAYNCCQCDESIEDGDVLYVESEGVVGVAYTWPFAVTSASGSLHSTSARTLKHFVEMCRFRDESEAKGKSLYEGAQAAVKFAQEKGLTTFTLDTGNE